MRRRSRREIRRGWEEWKLEEMRKNMNVKRRKSREDGKRKRRREEGRGVGSAEMSRRR